MLFATSALALVASAASVSAAKVSFWTLDDVQRTIYFTSNENSAPIDPVVVNNKKNTTVDFPDTYIGNYYAVKDGAENKPGMLGEVNFNAYNGLTFFDVSAIVDPNDKDNVKQMWPMDVETPMSGCEVFPCDNAYYLWDDVQTKSTPVTHIMTTLGHGSVAIAQ